MMSLATTDEPPTAGFLTDEHLALMERLGLLEEPEQVRKGERIRRERIFGKLQEAALVDGSSTERQLIESLHRYIARSPAQFITVTLSDGVGNRRPFVLGGGYPDWRYPYTDGAGASVLVDQLPENARFNSLLETLDAELRGE